MLGFAKIRMAAVVGFLTPLEQTWSNHPWRGSSDDGAPHHDVSRKYSLYYTHQTHQICSIYFSRSNCSHCVPIMLYYILYYIYIFMYLQYPWLAPGWNPEGPAKKNSQRVPGDLSPHIYPSSCLLYFGVVSEFYSPDTLTIKYRNSKRSWPQSHGILSRRDFGTWNSSSSDFGRSVWRAWCAIGSTQIPVRGRWILLDIAVYGW